MKPMLSASLMCADLLNVGRDLELLAEARVEYLHFDIMDGHFVPNLMLPPDFAKAVRRAGAIPFDIHLMVENPERVIPLFDIKPGDVVSVHYESTVHVHRALSMVNERGAAAALALNPATPIECAREVLPDVGMVLLMTVNPGYAGQKLVPQGIGKIRRMRAMLDELGYADLPIEVDGNCSFENAPVMYTAGASVFVVGSSSVFDPKLGIVEGAARFRKAAESSSLL